MEPSWYAQLGIAVPFVIALGFIGKWLIGRLDRAEKDKDTLYERIATEVVPALTRSTEALERVAAYLRDADEDKRMEQRIRDRREGK